MNNISIITALAIILSISSKAVTQDAAFTQWENIPIYVNPALTGNYDGLFRFRAKYRNQWESLLKDNSYRTSAVSAEYKFPTGGTHKISVGVLGLQDKSGSLDFRNSSINFVTAVIQNLGNSDYNHHSISFGVNVGLANRKIDLEGAQWPGGMPPDGLTEKTNFADVAAGLLWQYKSKAHFSYQVGGGLHHINKPNVSFYDTNVVKLYHRLNLHGNVEIPLTQSFSIVPSFLFWSQGPSEQLLFGLNSRWYPKLSIPNFLQFGIFAKTTKNIYGTDINIYVLSASAEIRSFLFGFSFDRFQETGSNAYEFSLGYTIGLPGT